MARLFISYRRDDSAYATGVIRDQLAEKLPGCEIFLDVDSIPYGVDFRQHLEQSVAACDYLIAVIGKRWLTAADSQGRRRLEDPNDAVRVEVETALRREIPLIPVFLDNMPVPTPDELPDSLRGLVGRNAIFVRPPPDFKNDIGRLVQSFETWLGVTGSGGDARAMAVPARPVKFGRKARLAGAAIAMLLAAVAIYGWRTSMNAEDSDATPEYEISESYLVEDDDATPDPWQARTRVMDGKLSLPVNYVHWIIVVTHGKHIRPTKILVESRVLGDEGEIVRFRGLSADIPDEKHPHSGKSEWILTYGLRNTAWKPGHYTLQMSTPTKTLSEKFEVPAAPSNPD